MARDSDAVDLPLKPHGLPTDIDDDDNGDDGSGGLAGLIRSASQTLKQIGMMVYRYPNKMFRGRLVNIGVFDVFAERDTPGGFHHMAKYWRSNGVVPTLRKVGPPLAINVATGTMMFTVTDTVASLMEPIPSHFLADARTRFFVGGAVGGALQSIMSSFLFSAVSHHQYHRSASWLQSFQAAPRSRRFSTTLRKTFVPEVAGLACFFSTYQAMKESFETRISDSIKHPRLVNAAVVVASGTAATCAFAGVAVPLARYVHLGPQPAKPSASKPSVPKNLGQRFFRESRALRRAVTRKVVNLLPGNALGFVVYEYTSTQ